ncbi:MAG: diadenylate cyclase [Bacilli bacterium]|nr:diadenylate cyclase [Bacilli bacterium]
MEFLWDKDLARFIISLVGILLIYGLLVFILIKVARRRISFIFLSVSFVLFLVGFIFRLEYLCMLVAFISAAGLAACFFANLGDVRKFIANPFSRVTAKAANFGIEKIYDSQQLFKNIESAVISLSNARIGAIITFEKNTSLKDIMKNGVPVHAPVTSELLLTIFYPGTRLHDGAVVIHGNEIVAASVFFTPTTKPFAGKYGSRHRAAIGISEISDAITVVVSEETGRISFAVNGDLEAVNQTNFLRVFENYMADHSSEE